MDYIVSTLNNLVHQTAFFNDLSRLACSLFRVFYNNCIHIN